MLNINIEIQNECIGGKISKKINFEIFRFFMCNETRIAIRDMVTCQKCFCWEFPQKSQTFSSLFKEIKIGLNEIWYFFGREKKLTLRTFH